MVLVCAAYLCGIYSTKYKQNKEENKSTITTIAVVNADSGTVVDGRNVNYAAELMTFPDTNFQSASLTEAREGVVNGRYAAYIMIPNNFSESIESVNGEPVKSQIAYEINQNLRQDAQIKVVNDIHNFVLNLSTNVSYVYVDAILQELHTVQNDSNSIMKNDIADMDAITKVQTSELIQEVEYEPLESVETEISYLDLTEDYKKVDQAVEDIYKTYEKDMEEAEAELVKVTKTGEAINPQITATIETLTQINIVTDEEDKCVYEEGRENLSNLAASYEQETIEKKQTAKERLGFQEGDEEPGPEPELPEGVEREYVSKADLIEQIDKQIIFIENVQETLYGTTTTAGTGGSTGNTEEPFTLTEEALVDSIQDLKDLEENIEEYYKNSIRAINEIPVPSDLITDADRIIVEEIEQPIIEEINKEVENVGFVK